MEETYGLEFEQVGRTLVATVRGEISPETDIRMDEELRRECERRGLGLLLVDIRPATSRLSALGNHYAATTFGERMGALRAVAIVDRPEFTANSEMFQVTAINRGANVRFFEDEVTAMEWLARHVG